MRRLGYYMITETNHGLKPEATELLVYLDVKGRDIRQLLDISPLFVHYIPVCPHK